MATPGDLPASSSGGLSDLQTLLAMFKGGATTTNSNTSSETVSADKANAYIKTMMEGNQGLASVAIGEKKAGLYNSSTNQLLTNDLLARIASQTAALSSTKTSTTATATGAQLSPGKTLLGAGAGALINTLLGPTIKAGAKSLGLDSAGQNISDAIFGKGAAASTAGSKAIFASGTDSLGGYAYTQEALSGGESALLDTSFLNGMAPSGAAATATGETVGAIGESTVDLGTFTGSLDMSAAAVGSELGADAAIGDIGAGALGDMFGGEALSAGADIAGTAFGAEAGAEAGIEGLAAAGAGEGLLAVAGPIGLGLLATQAVAQVFGIKELKWIVCTELNRQGRLPTRFYIYGAKVFAAHDDRVKQGYYVWAIPAVKHLREHPASLFSKTLAVVFKSRAEYLAAQAGCRTARKTLFGAATVYCVYGFCWILSRTIARKAYTSQQILGA